MGEDREETLLHFVNYFIRTTPHCTGPAPMDENELLSERCVSDCMPCGRKQLSLEATQKRISSPVCRYRNIYMFGFADNIHISPFALVLN